MPLISITDNLSIFLLSFFEIVANTVFLFPCYVHKPWPRLCTTLTEDLHKMSYKWRQGCSCTSAFILPKIPEILLEVKWTGLFRFGLTRIFGMSTLTGLTNWFNASLLFQGIREINKKWQEPPFVWPVLAVKCCTIFIGKFHWSLSNQSGIMETTLHVR